MVPLRLSILLWICAQALSPVALSQSQFGRYIGVLKHSQIDQDQLAKLDFIVSRENASEFKLIAILTLYFGDYDSREYITYHFDAVNYNVVTGAMVFDQPDQEVTVVAERFADGRFEARLRSVSTGEIGILQLSQEGPALPTRPLVQPLWGEYQSVCDGVKSVMQIQTQRSTGDSSRMGNPFGTYETSAQIADIDSSCMGYGDVCVKSVFDAGSYNFFNGAFNMQGRNRELSCKVSASGINCDSCMFTRTSNEGAALGAKTFPAQQSSFAPQPPSTSPSIDTSSLQLSGTYHGYLHHERLGVYQPVSLNVVTYQGQSAGGGSALFVSAVSHMYFGGFDSQEYVTHRFNEKEFPLLSKQIVLERIAGDVDAVIQLESLGNGKAQGTWYSILFGRVGRFELVKGSLPQPPPGATVMAKISGAYVGGKWDLNLRVIRESTPISSVNPFYPLNFSGTFRFRDVTPNIRISGGSFDFYTGKLSMRLESNTLFSGFRANNKDLQLKRPTPGVIRPMTPHEMQTFAKVPPLG